MKKIKLEDLKIKSFSANENSKVEFGGIATAGYGGCYTDFYNACYSGGGATGGGYYSPLTSPQPSTSSGVGACNRPPTSPAYTSSNCPGGGGGTDPSSGCGSTNVDIGGDCRTSPDAGGMVACTTMGIYPGC